MHNDVPDGYPQAIQRLRKWGGEQLVREMAELFITDAPRRIARAQAAATRGEWANVESEAHSLKSSCGQMGAQRMRDICTEIEIHAAGANHIPIALLLSSLDEEFASFGVWLDHFTSNVNDTTHE